MILPLAASRQSKRQEVPSGDAEVTKTRSSQTMGDDHAIPGIKARHARFSRRLQVSGRFFSCEIPWPVGPRNPGQFSPKQGLIAAQAVLSVQRRLHRSRILVIVRSLSSSPAKPADVDHSRGRHLVYTSRRGVSAHLIEQHPLHQHRVVQAADAHSQELDRQVPAGQLPDQTYSQSRSQ
jgi:hypothetical protein